MTIPPPSAVSGFRLALRLFRLVAAVWLVSVAIFVPVQAIVEVAAGPAFAKVPANGLGAGEDLLVFFNVMRPVVVPLAVTLGCCLLVLLAWWILWHGGTVRWWLNADTAEVRLARIMGHGLEVWWRYTRLALFAFILQVVVLATPWLTLRADVGERFVLPLLVLGSVLTVVATALVWLATLRGMWLLGESGRRSAVVAWFRGLWTAVRQPLRSFAPIIVWALPGLALLVLPLLIEGPPAILATLVAWAASAFCWVALHLSYALPKPPPARPVDPLAPPGPFVTTRFPTLLRKE